MVRNRILEAVEAEPIFSIEEELPFSLAG